ncbi:MAG: site-specific integrase [Bacillota bacterium]
MRGYIEQRGPNSFRLTIRLGFNPVTKQYERYRETFQGKKDDAETRLAELITQYKKGFAISPERMTFADFADLWLKDYVNVNLAPKTREGYARIIELHLKPAFGALLLQKMQPFHLRNYYAQALAGGRKDDHKSRGPGLSKRSVLHQHRLLHKMLADAVRWELVGRNVADAVDPPRPGAREIAIPTEEEAARLLGVGREHPYLGMPVLLALTTGMRLGEILGLRWQDVDLKKGRLTVYQAAQVTKGEDGRQKVFFKAPKTKKSRRTIDLPEMTVQALKEHQRRQKEWRLAMGPAWQDHGLVCCLQDGRPINTGTLSTAFRKLAAKLGLSVSFHSLRHFHASLLLKAGTHPKVVSERLGHSTISLTMDTYSHVMDGLQREAARKIDALLGG